MPIELEHINLIPTILQELTLIRKSLEHTEVKRWLTVKEVGHYLGYSADRIYKLKEEIFIENVHFYKKSGKILFDKVAIDEWMVKKDTYHELKQSQRQTVDNILSSIQTVSKEFES